jgi:hypothetical protein
MLTAARPDSSARSIATPTTRSRLSRGRAFASSPAFLDGIALPSPPA